MGQVIRFRREALRRALDAPQGASEDARLSKGYSGEAQILFFMGVRYSRDENDDGMDNTPNRPPASRSRRKKTRLIS
jgi:hypothetical protein